MESRSETDGLAVMSPDDLHILSVGISTGGEAEAKMLLNNPHRKVVATTLDERGIQAVEEKMKALGLTDRIELKVENIADETLAYNDQTFDYIYARLVLHYLSAQELEVACTSVYRLLRPGGRVFAVVRSTDTPEIQNTSTTQYDELTHLTTYITAGGTSAKRYFHTINSISSALRKAGLAIENVEQFDEKLSPDFTRESGIWAENNLIEVLASKPN